MLQAIWPQAITFPLQYIMLSILEVEFHKDGNMETLKQMWWDCEETYNIFLQKFFI